jgi:hypothetical protein
LLIFLSSLVEVVAEDKLEAVAEPVVIAVPYLANRPVVVHLQNHHCQ